MTATTKQRVLRDFVMIALVQWAGFPLIGRLLGMGDRVHAPSWIVIVLTSGMMALAAEAMRKAKRA